MADSFQTPASIFEDEIRSLLAAEEREASSIEPVLFYGSSSIRLWEGIGRDFAGIELINRGFGGSTLSDCVHQMERLVFSLRPRAVVLYAGDNDLDQGVTPEQVQRLFQHFATLLFGKFGPIPLLVISIKPSPSRFWNVGNICGANALLRDAVVGWKNARFVNVFPLMLTSAGQPRRELYTEDGLHLNAEGYRLWAASVRASFEDIGLAP